MGDWARDAAELDRRLGREQPTQATEPPTAVLSSADGDGRPRSPKVAHVAEPTPVSIYGYSRREYTGTSESFHLHPMAMCALQQHGVVEAQSVGDRPRLPRLWHEVSDEWFSAFWKARAAGLKALALYQTAPAAEAENHLFPREVLEGAVVTSPADVPPGTVCVTDYDPDTKQLTVSYNGSVSTVSAADLANVDNRHSRAAGSWQHSGPWLTLGPSPLRSVYWRWWQLARAKDFLREFAATCGPPPRGRDPAFPTEPTPADEPTVVSESPIRTA